MARKRSNGEGCISQERSGPSKGRYRIVLTWKNGDKVERRSRTAWKMADATAILAELKAERVKGLVKVKGFTTAQYLDHWLAVLEVDPSTLSNYRYAVNKYMKPGIGAYLIADLSPLLIEKWWKDFKAGDRTRENCYVLIKAAMAHAVNLKLLAADPCAVLKRPKYKPKAIDPFTVDEAKEILSYTKGSRWNVAAILGLMTGMRIGEILGLEWSHVDWKNKKILIEQQATTQDGKTVIKAPKTKSSIRAIAMTDEVASALRDHQVIMLREGNAGCKLVTPSPRGFVCQRGNAATSWWNPMLKHLQLKHRGFHHMRHTFATHALLNLVPLLVVSGTLGHARPSITLNIYGHLLKESEDRAVETIAKLFG